MKTRKKTMEFTLDIIVLSGLILSLIKFVYPLVKGVYDYSSKGQLHTYKTISMLSTKEHNFVSIVLSHQDSIILGMVLFILLAAVLEWKTRIFEKRIIYWSAKLLVIGVLCFLMSYQFIGVKVDKASVTSGILDIPKKWIRCN